MYFKIRKSISASITIYNLYLDYSCFDNNFKDQSIYITLNIMSTYYVKLMRNYHQITKMLIMIIISIWKTQII